MVFKWLKKIRVFISLAFFLAISYLSIDYASTFSSSLTNSILYFQFLPSWIKFMNLMSFMATGYLVVLILTLLFGRVYCSFLCPLGTLQDLFHFISNRSGKRKSRKFSGPNNWVRYLFLTAPILLFVAGNILLLNLLDPYSNFSRILSNLVRPLYYGINNVVVDILEKWDIYAIKPVELKSVSLYAIGYSVFMLGLVAWMAFQRGRLFCNTVCPAGTFLGIISRLSLFRIRLDESLCNSCGICGNSCKSDCIDTLTKKVDFSRCVGCLNCLYVCPEGGVKFGLTQYKASPAPAKPEFNHQRRHFLKYSAFIPAVIAFLSKRSYSEGLNNGKIPVEKEYPVTPPGSVSIRHFINNCTACHLCVSACPTRVLQPAFLQYGLAGILQPTMDYNISFCNFECTVCSEICPTGAIKPIDLTVKKVTQLGIAKFIKENCVVYIDETDCGACSEHCPTKAVVMVYYKDKITIPEVTEEICIGCGACEYACPTDPKSIYVDGNIFHKQAEKPTEKSIGDTIQPADDFPF